jgi:hypothetical protein
VRLGFVHPFNQRSYEHRKVWLQQSVMFLDSGMAIDIEGFCSMANHLAPDHRKS